MAIRQIAAQPAALARKIEAMPQSPRLTKVYAAVDRWETRNSPHDKHDTALAPFPSAAAFQIWGR